MNQKSKFYHVGEILQWPVDDQEGRLIVRGLEEEYANHTNEEIADLMRCINGVYVIVGKVVKVCKDGCQCEIPV